MIEAKCKRCGGPLGATDSVAACPKCGAFFGLQQELERHAEAVVRGDPNAQRPASLPPEVVATGGGGERHGYRSEGGRWAHLVVRSRPSRRLLSFLLALLPIGVTAYGWYLHRRLVEIPIVLLLVTGISALFAGIWVRDALRGKVVELEVAGDTLRVPIGGLRSGASLVLSDIEQLYVLAGARVFALLARVKGRAEQRVVALFRDGPTALFAERLVERAAGIPNHAVDQELSGFPPQPRMLWFVRLGVLGLFLGTIPMFQACGEPLTEMELRAEPRTEQVTLTRGGRLFFSAEVDLERAEYLSAREIPSSHRYRIRVSQGGEVLADLVCDPLDMFIWVNYSSNKRISALEGSLRGCSVEVSAGAVEVAAWYELVPGVPPVRYESLKLVPRLE